MWYKKVVDSFKIKYFYIIIQIWRNNAHKQRCQITLSGAKIRAPGTRYLENIRECGATRSAGKFGIVGLPTDAGPTSRVIRRAIYFTAGPLLRRAWRSAALRPLDDFNKLSKQRLGARVLALAWEGINATDELKAAICRSSHHLSKDTTCIIELGAIILERRRNREMNENRETKDRRERERESHWSNSDRDSSSLIERFPF